MKPGVPEHASTEQKVANGPDKLNVREHKMAGINASATKKQLESKWLILTAVMLGTFMTPLDGSIVNTVLPSITTFFHTDISIVQ